MCYYNSRHLGLITIYDNVLLQFTTDITIYDDSYYNLRQVLQFTTEHVCCSFYLVI